jgi:hypothetical protein
VFDYDKSPALSPKARGFLFSSLLLFAKIISSKGEYLSTKNKNSPTRCGAVFVWENIREVRGRRSIRVFRKMGSDFFKLNKRRFRSRRVTYDEHCHGFPAVLFTKYANLTTVAHP